MKKLFKHTFIIALAVMALVSCSSKYEYDGPGKWNANDGYAQVSFVKTSISVEVVPTAPTQTTIELKRLNTEGAVTVDFEIESNTDDVFVVSPVQFADGEETATAVVNFPTAEIGKTYTLKLIITDPDLVSQYSANNTCTLSIIRVQWNDVGFYYADAGKTEKVEGWGKYTDLFAAYWFGGDELSFPTRIQERDDLKGYFRLVNTYDYHYPYNDPESAIGEEWWSEEDGTPTDVTREDLFDYSENYYIYIDATDPKKVFIPSACNLGFDWGYGNFYIHSLAGYYINQGDMEEAAKYYGKYENGVITFPKNSLLSGMANYNGGGLYQVSSGNFRVVINPDEELYTATFEDYDFTEEVFTGSFESEVLKTSVDGILLLKGVRRADLDKDCYDRFEDANGDPYMIVSPYAEGYNLYFCVNADGKIVVPKESANQLTGVQSMGKKVYAHINGGQSTFSENVVVLNITFQDETGDTNYGEGDETLSNITWTSLGIGLYVDDFVTPLYTQEGIPYAYEVEIEECDQTPGQYRILNAYAPLAEAFEEEGGNENIIIHAEDPEGVYILEQRIGLDFDDGDMSIVTQGGRYVEANGFDLVKEQVPEYLGTLEKGVITFPTFTTESGLDYQGIIYIGAYGYYGGMNGAVEIYLPEAYAADASLRAKAQSRAKAASFAKRLNASKKFAAKTKRSAKSHGFGKGTKANAKYKRVLKTPSSAPLFVK